MLIRRKGWINDLQETCSVISSSTQESAHQAVEQHAAQSERTASQKIKDVRQLIQDGYTANTCLSELQQLVENCDLPFKDQAQSLRSTYTTLLSNSRLIAGSARSCADDLRGEVIDFVLTNAPNREKIAMVVRLKTTIEEKVKLAVGQPGHFKEFAAHLLESANFVHGKIDSEDEESKTKVEKYVSELDTINAEIASLAEHVVSPLIDYLRLSDYTVARKFSGSPASNLDILLGIVRTSVPELEQFYSHLHDTLEELQTLEEHKERIRKDIRPLVDELLRKGSPSVIPLSLRSISEDIIDLAGKLAVFIDDFSQVSQQAQEVLAYLQAGTLANDKEFSLVLKLQKESLSMQSRILDIYSKASLP